MSHQDFKVVVFNTKEQMKNNEKKKEVDKKISQKQIQTNDNSILKIKADKKFGQLLSQSRLVCGYKTQSDFVKKLNQNGLNISAQIYSKWENNKENPTNEQISKIEKVLKVKLPRNKKVIFDI